jgi:hypothetical protein
MREGILSFTGITNRRSEELKMEAKRLQDEFVILKIAIEKAINKGQELIDVPNDIPGSDLVPDEDFALTYMNAGSGAVGWVDDF